MPQKRVLIITYYWPPSGGSGVQRWLKFVKYLPQFGWTPVVYTPRNPSFALRDESLSREIPPGTEVVREPIWEPHDIFFWFSKRFRNSPPSGHLASAGDHSVFQRLISWIRGNLFIPDARRYWIKPSVRFLSHYLTEHPVDVIISTGPPHSMHLIALRLANRSGIPWLADFRDPWTTLNAYHELKLSGWSDRRHHALEKEVLTQASVVTVVGKSMKTEFDGKRNGKTIVLTNGYDDEDFSLVPTGPLDREFTFLHAGSFVPRRNPIALWAALAELKEENHPMLADFRLNLTGQVDAVIKEALGKAGLLEYCTLTPYLPHAEVVRQLRAAQVLLLPIDDFEGSKMILTGKLFEYLAAKRPILCIGPPTGDAADLLRETGSGVTCDFRDAAGIKEQLKILYDHYKNGSLSVSGSSTEQYSRRALTEKLAHELNSMTS